MARLARARVCAGFPSAREGLLVNARFLLAQFEKLDSGSGHKALKFADTDFGKALAKEVSERGREGESLCVCGLGKYVCAVCVLGVLGGGAGRDAGVPRDSAQR